MSELVLRVSADAYLGSSEFVVSVDGIDLPGTYSTSASHASGDVQDVVISGDFSDRPGSIGVRFVNDAYDGWGKDRNLYVESLSVGGVTLAGDAGANGAGPNENGEARLYSNGSVIYDLTHVQWPAPASVPQTDPAASLPAADAGTNAPPSESTLHHVTLRVSEDAYLGDAQFTVMVDGQPFGGVQSVSALHGLGQVQEIDLAGVLNSAPTSVSVTFLNDAYGGFGLDRNLYVSGIDVDGTAVALTSAHGAGTAQAGSVELLSNGTVTFDVPVAAPSTTGSASAPSTPAPATTTPPPTADGSLATGGSPLSHLSLQVSEDAWNGDAHFSVQVDGVTIGSDLVATTAHSSGATQTFDFVGAFQNAHEVTVTFLNDAYGGWNADRNLYVHALEVNGQTFTGDQSTNSAGPNAQGVANLYSNGSVTIDVGSSSVTAPVPVPDGLSLLGVNLAGAEFGTARPGTFGTDYTYPTHAEIDYVASKGLNIVRLPFLWERLQDSPNAALDPTELSRIDDFVHYAAQKGLKVILDPHDFGAAFGSVIGEGATSNAAFADFWGKLASHFADQSNVIFGLMNEPNQQSASDWLISANAAIKAIRDVGATQEILVPGSYWDTASTWTTSDNAAVVGTGVQDPLHNFAFEVHQYLDANGTGTEAGVSSASVGVDRLQAVTAWAEAHGAKLFLGEFGVTTDSTSLSALDAMLNYMSAHASVWQGGTYWAGGPWWGDSNIYGIEPKLVGSTLVDQPQMEILTQHLTS